MPITAACPVCGSVHTSPDSAAGRTLKCRKCAAPVAIPAAPAEEEFVEFEAAAGVMVEGPDDFDHTDPLVAVFVEQFAVNE